MTIHLNNGQFSSIRLSYWYSSKNVLFGTGVFGQIVVMDRKWLDPRRPTGEPKYSEIKEGLMK